MRRRLASSSRRRRQEIASQGTEFGTIGRSRLMRNPNVQVRNRPNQVGTYNNVVGFLAEIGARSTHVRQKYEH